MSSLSSLSNSDDFEFVEAEAVAKQTIEEKFIKDYQKHQSVINSLHQQRRVFQQTLLTATPHLRSYLTRLQKQQSASFRDTGDWILAETRRDGNCLGQLEVLRQARQLFFEDSKLTEELDKLIRDLSGEKSEDGKDKEAYSVEQHLFDLTIIKKSIRLLRNVLATTTAEKFSKLYKNQTDNVRTYLFGLLDHLKRWFQHLLQRYQWFLEIKHVKLVKCCASTKLSQTLAELPTITKDFHSLTDQFLAHFKLAFGFCERFCHEDIMYFFYEALVHLCLQNKSLFEQLLWTKEETNKDVLKERIELMEHQAGVLEKMISTNPLDLVEQTSNPEAAYCAYIWLKSDLCLQHFRCLFDARQGSFGFCVDEEKKWLCWATDEDLLLEKMPAINQNNLSVEKWLTEDTKKQTKELETLMDEVIREKSAQIEREMNAVRLVAS